MSTSPFASVVASLLIVAIVAPSAFFLAPQKAHAFGLDSVVVIGDVSPTSLLQLAKDTLIEIHSFTSAVAEYALWMNTFIFQPLLFILSGRLLRSMTAGVIGFVVGTVNGTGAPQFVRDVRGNMQAVSDASAFAFINLYGSNSQSPFAASIVSAMRMDYLQNSSLAGFFAANRDTLYRTSPNINAYLAGDWSQGGLASWFALTTQDNNNPYMLYLNSQSRLRSLTGPGVGGATGARASELAWGQGMLSWCGVDENANDAGQNTIDTSAGMGDGTGTNPSDSAYGTTASLTPTDLKGTIPGDPCVNKDGTPGKVKTPGSVISSTLNKVLGSTQDKIVQMGALASEVNLIMGDITRIMQTVNIARNVLGGLDSGGLLGADIHGTGAFLGVTAANVYQNASGNQNTATNRVLLSEKTKSVDQYESAWLTIKSSADTAIASVNSLAGSCVAAAQTAVTIEIQPVLDLSASAATVVMAARPMIQKIQDELDSGADASADIQKLIAMPPSSTDVTNASRDAQVSGGATSTPSGSLTVSGGSVVDRMNLIRTNASAMVCTP